MRWVFRRRPHTESYSATWSPFSRRSDSGDAPSTDYTDSGPMRTTLGSKRCGPIALTDSADILGVAISAEGATEIARRSRGTPRIVNRLLRRVRDYAQVKAHGEVTADVADAALQMLKVDANGFDQMDRRLLKAVIEKFDGGPVGLDSLAAAIGEERGTIEDVLEPYLIQQGYLMRTPRGRMATRASFIHFGLNPPKTADSPDLFADLADD